MGAVAIVHLDPTNIMAQTSAAQPDSSTSPALSGVPVRYANFFAALLGKSPPDSHIWTVMDEVPAFVKFEGPLATGGPVWRIELTSPRWPK